MTTKIYTALVNFQNEVEAPKLDAVNPHFKSKYASLGSIVSTVRPALARNGLGFAQFVGGEPGFVSVTTRVFHVSGESLESTVSAAVDPGRRGIQDAGAIVTYLRRYSLSAVLGLYADEDNDAEPVPAPVATKPKAKAKPAPDVLTLGVVVARLVDDGVYTSAEDVYEALAGFEFPDGFVLDEAQKISEAGAKKVSDWLVDRLFADDDARGENSPQAQAERANLRPTKDA